MCQQVQKGLEGVVVAESSLSAIDGDAGQLVYRGYPIGELAADASFEEVLYLLWHGELPDRGQLAAFTDEMAAERAVDEDIINLVCDLVDAGERPMPAIRTGVSMLSAHEPENDSDAQDLEAALRKGRRITARIPTVLAAIERERRGERPLEPREDLGYAANFLYMLDSEEPDGVAVEALDRALILHADHGLNASTFTAMVVASTLADMYSAITAGIAALGGPLHGGANQDVMEMLVEIDDSGEDPVEWVTRALEKREDWRVPGFGHRVYNVKDPRAEILQEQARELGEASGDRKWYGYTTAIEEYLTDEVGLTGRGIAPNVDFYSGSVYYQLDIPIDMYTPIFAMSRTGGWVGHVLEYQKDNRLIRPRARYVGEEERPLPPIEER